MSSKWLFPMILAGVLAIALIAVLLVFTGCGKNSANPFSGPGTIVPTTPRGDGGGITIRKEDQAPGWWRLVDKDWTSLRLDGTIPNSSVRRKVYDGNLDGATLAVVSRTVQVVHEVPISGSLALVSRAILANSAAYSVRIREKNSSDLKTINIVLIDGTETSGGKFPDGWMWEVNPEGNKIVRIDSRFFL